MAKPLLIVIISGSFRFPLARSPQVTSMQLWKIFLHAAEYFFRLVDKSLICHGR